MASRCRGRSTGSCTRRCSEPARFAGRAGAARDRLGLTVRSGFWDCPHPVPSLLYEGTLVPGHKVIFMKFERLALCVALSFGGALAVAALATPSVAEAAVAKKKAKKAHKKGDEE